MREECEEKGQQRGERDERGAEGERSVREKWEGTRERERRDG